MIQEKILQTIKKYHLFKKKDAILICISGGFDSTALLLLLNELKDKFSFQIKAAHFNHMLRGKESEEDENFIRKLAGDLNIPLKIGRKDVKAIAKKQKSSLEEIARELRYKFFFETADKFKIDKIAIAHTKNDVAETFLMRILRGSGLAGLSGIWPKRNIQGYTVIRPLIEISKQEILDYLNQKKIKARLDSSNLSDAYLRNKIRLRLLPLLEREYNPNLKDTLTKEADILRQIYKSLEKKAEKLFKKRARLKKGEILLNLKGLNKEDIAVVHEILRKCILRTKGDLKKITFEHLMSLSKMIKIPYGSSSVILPDIEVIREYDNLRFCKKAKLTKKFIRLPDRLRIPGVTYIDGLGFNIEAKMVSSGSFRQIRDGSIEYLDLNKIKRPVVLRFKKAYDKFKPLGMKKQKSLKDFFIDSKVPKSQRDKIPLVVSNGKIIWVVGLRISDTVKITKDTEKILRLKLLKRF